MSTGIKFTSREMRYIALFQSITGATVKDCIVDNDLNRIIFVVKEGNIGMAIGKKGKNIHTLEKMTGKKHEVIEHSENPAQFIKNAL
ncbi:NusA-like transcription termination signal-binding factor, partial [Candidatus Bathyarchaeota archaeon]